MCPRREHTTLHACAARARRAVGRGPGDACARLGGHAASRTWLLPPLPLQRVALSAARLLMLGLFLPLPTHSRDVCGRLLKGKTN